MSVLKILEWLLEIFIKYYMGAYGIKHILLR